MFTEKTKLIIPKSEAKDKLQKQIKQGETILKKLVELEDSYIPNESKIKLKEMCRKWSLRSYEILRQIFSDYSVSQEYESKHVAICNTQYRSELDEPVKNSLRVLGDVLIRLKYIPEINTVAVAIKNNSQKVNNKIFIVHGHDEGAKEVTARFIEHLDLKPIILSEQPNEGLTIIEKFERHAGEASFAIVLMTPDDVGASVKNRKELNLRVRQNVVYELAFFSGKLGRNRVLRLI